ncbi:MAG: TetR/AcrR family transcriptional regulator [Zoogloeaceae bacterium]|jgi:AcrR family transcriptional regulator|nr:TetR/AcrR family transcriptional regulator [Zoogloeaceae bacterium]
MEEKTIRKARQPSLDRSAWIKGALAALSEEGHAGLRVETLAKRLNVTKGSFYWHFEDRHDLVGAVLEAWKLGRIADIHKQTAAPSGKELAALRHTLEVYSTSRNRKGLPIELAVREWANRDTRATAIVAEVDAERMRCTARLFEKLGASPAEATARSLLLYAYVFGFSLMRCDHFLPNPAAAKVWIADCIACVST